eukprot:2866090-Rhodomonas_salina.1
MKESTGTTTSGSSITPSQYQRAMNLAPTQYQRAMVLAVGATTYRLPTMSTQGLWPRKLFEGWG